MSEEVKDIQSTEKKNDTSSYRSIFKATSLFGGVEVYNILIHIIRSKFIAVLLGPFGIGVQGLYQSALDLIRQVTSLGLSQSAVRDIAEAHGTGDIKRISRSVTVLRRIVWYTGLLGMIAVIAFSPLLSKASFGNNDHIIPFVFLSVILLLTQLSAGQKVVLQGMRRLKDLAKASSIGITVSLLITLPLYYILGVSGIVPAMILMAMVTLLISWFYSRKIKIDKQQLSTKEVFSDGKSMMIMGVSMSLSGVFSIGAAYLIRGMIRKWGGIDEVGLYQAGFVIVNTYVGLIFNAISTDYYPRLAAINNDNNKCREVVSKQGEISVLILAPILSIGIVLMPLVIQILYSDKFVPADHFIKWAFLGMMFKLASWLVSYIFIAKAESKLFIINELAGNATNLALSLIGYKIAGLTGLGIAFAASFFVYFWQVYIIAHIRYKFRFSKEFISSFILQLVLVSIILVSIITLKGFIKYIIGSAFAVISIAIAWKGLNDKIELMSFVKTKLFKK